MTIDLMIATPQEIAMALLALDETRPGLAYDVGMFLYEQDASKDMPGPAGDWYEGKGEHYHVVVTGYATHQKVAAMAALRRLWGFGLEEVKTIFDKLDDCGETVSQPEWLGMTPIRVLITRLQDAKKTVTELTLCGIQAKVEPAPLGPPYSNRRSMREELIREEG